MITNIKDINPNNSENGFIGARLLHFFKVLTNKMYAINAGSGMHIKESIVIALILKIFEKLFVKIVKAIFQIFKLLRTKKDQKI